MAGAAAIGHHLVSRQADATHPAGSDRDRFCPERDRPLLISHGLLSWDTLGTRSGLGAGSGDVHRRGGGFERRVPSLGSPVSQPFILPVADLGYARVIWPAGLHMQALPSAMGERRPAAPACREGRCARRDDAPAAAACAGQLSCRSDAQPAIGGHLVYPVRVPAAALALRLPGQAHPSLTSQISQSSAKITA